MWTAGRVETVSVLPCDRVAIEWSAHDCDILRVGVVTWLPADNSKTIRKLRLKASVLFIITHLAILNKICDKVLLHLNVFSGSKFC